MISTMFGTYASNQISTGAAQNGVTTAIRNASLETGVDFNYLLQQAKVESSLNPNARARTSSATGLYQFIEQTWLQMVKSHGAEHGYNRYANAIRQNANGDYVVPNRAMRNEILNLRRDPKASSLMAAELATENHNFLQSRTGRTPGKTDLYMAHFLGAGGASNFIKSMNKNPWAPAASIFPEAARTNRGVFYAQGRPLSLQQVYNNFQKKIEAGGSDNGSVIKTAEVPSDVKAAYQGFALPEADNWSDPTGRVSRFSGSSRTAGNLRALYAPLPPAPVKLTQQPVSVPVPGGYLSSPVEVMFIANQMHMEHNNNDRYNA